MTAIFLYTLGGLGVLVVLSSIPGLKPIMTPFMELVFWLIKTGFEHLGTWVVWLIKTTLNDHQTLLAHLSHRAEELDVTLEMQRDAK